MKNSIQSLIQLFDIPSGSILGLFTLVVIGIGIHAYSANREITTSVVECWKYALGVFAGSKGIQTYLGKRVTEKPTDGK
jgi:hypothetical protein